VFLLFLLSSTFLILNVDLEQLPNISNTTTTTKPFSPKQVEVVLVFMTMNLYRGDREIEKTMITQETQGFLDRFRPPGG
jgi:hypothetical protein